MPLSRLLSSLKTSPRPQPQPYPQLQPSHDKVSHTQRLRGDRWHQEILSSHHVEEYLSRGGRPLQSSRLGVLKRITWDYLDKLRLNLNPPSTECDTIIGALLDDHRALTSRAREVATLACLSALSISAGTHHLRALMDIDIERYLRCIILAHQVNPRIVSIEEHGFAQSLLLIISEGNHGCRQFEELNRILEASETATFIPHTIMKRALAKPGVRNYLQMQLNVHLEQGEYLNASLLIIWPDCYRRIYQAPLDQDRSEIFMDLLSKSYTLGLGALELFVYLCVNKPADDAAVSIVQASIRKGDSRYCSSLLLLICETYEKSRLNAQHAGSGGEPQSSPSFSFQYIAERSHLIIENLQTEFYEQLESGTGDYLAMRIYRLGTAIQNVPDTHPHTPEELLTLIRGFPDGYTLYAIFDQIQLSDETIPIRESRLKSYLASALCGVGEGGSITVTALQKEVTFWKHPPNTDRRDLAKRLGRIHSIDYSLYTTCLLEMLQENDLHVIQIGNAFAVENSQVCAEFAKYLDHRRGLGQLQHDCWLLLLGAMFKAQGPNFLPRMADSLQFDSWLSFTDNSIRLLGPVQSKLPESGDGMTQERLSWWQTLSRNMTAIDLLFEIQGGIRNGFTWLFFPSSQSDIMELLVVLSQGQSMQEMHRQIISHLSPDGSNVSTVCECIRTIAQASVAGQAVCRQIFWRSKETGVKRWTQQGLELIFETWRRSSSLNRVDKTALDLISNLFGTPRQRLMRFSNPGPVIARLEKEFDTLIRSAIQLESARLRLPHETPQQASDFLQRIGVHNGSGRVADVTIPEELVDSVEPIGASEYEISFALTCLSDLQRKARGIDPAARLLLVHLWLQGKPKFCIHFSPNDEGPNQHDPWEPADDKELSSAVCTAKPNVFAYHLGQKLNLVLKRGNASLESIHSSILTLVTEMPSTCLVCSASIGTKLWKPASCSKNCSFKLPRAPIEVQLHNLLVDPLSIDLLLTCVYEAAADSSNLNLLPGCPVQKARVRAVIDSFPSLVTLQQATNLRSALRGLDGYQNERENLLSWMCNRFRGFIVTAQGGYRVPSMPNTRQFLVVNSSHEKEQLFKIRLGNPTNTGVVFHGTRVSRLFSILTTGLQVMSNTPYMSTGAAYGSGIYCGDDQQTSIGFAGTTGRSWSNSALRNLRLLLGCEVANYTAPVRGNIHCINDQDSVLVRYIFLVPQNYQVPPRRHVEPAMSITFASLRSGSLT